MIPLGISTTVLYMYVKSETPCMASSVHIWCLDGTNKVISDHLISLEPNDTCKDTYYVLFLIMQVGSSYSTDLMYKQKCIATD